MSSATTLVTFDIRSFTDRLQPSSEKGKSICPACGKGNFSISKELNEAGVPSYTCWNGCTRSDIKEVLSPFKEAIAEAQRQQGNSARRTKGKSYKPRPKAPKPAQLPSEITLARLAEPAIDSPQPCRRPDSKHGEVTVWRFNYSPTQWVERIQWVDAEKPKGYDKTYRQWHSAIEGEEVPLWENGEKVGTRKVVAGEAVYSKGVDPWLFYRQDEAIQAAQSTRANFMMGVEGEPPVEQYRQLGMACITLQGSACTEASANDLAWWLKSKNLGLVYHPDHDKTGYSKARMLQQACDRAGVPYLQLDPTALDSDVGAKEDVVDMVKRMGGDEFIQRLEAEIHRATENRLIEQDGTQAQGSQEKPQRGRTPAEIAAEIAEDYRDRLVWNDKAGQWYRYEAEFPGVWSAESDTAIGSVILAEFESRMGVVYKASWIEQCIKILRWRLIVKHWEQPPKMIPFRNGVLDTQSGQMLSHAPGYRFTWALPRDHNPLATDWGTIEKWLNEATDNSPKLKAILLCWLNACIKGRSDLQRFLYLTGGGGTGKGTFMRLAISLVGGENNHSSNLADWCGNRFETVNAYGKKLLTFADEDKYKGGLSNLKKVTGGDAIRGEAKNKQAFDFTFGGMVMLSSNYPIFSSDTSSGIYRRVQMAPFNKIIPPQMRKDLGAAFEPELAALTNYVLSIPDDVVSETLRQSDDQAPEVIARSWDWRMRQDSVAAWLNEHIIQDPQACERVGSDKEDAETLFGSYYLYCEKTGSRPKGSREFSPALLELVNNEPALSWGIEKKRVTGGFMIRGLRLRKEGDMDQPYCLEALSDVGSGVHVESDVGLNVGSEPLSSKGYVGYVESTDLVEKKIEPHIATGLVKTSSENLSDQDRPPCTPYITQSQQEVDILHLHPTEQGHSSCIESKAPKLLNNPLKPEMLIQVLQSMATIQSVRSFEEFKTNYERLTDDQQRQVWSDARPEVQQNYQHWQDAFLEVPESVWTARRALLRVVNLDEMNAVRQEHDRDVLSLALKLIHTSNQKSLKRLLKLSKQEQP